MGDLLRDLSGRNKYKSPPYKMEIKWNKMELGDLLRDLLTRVINQILSGMILQVRIYWRYVYIYIPVYTSHKIWVRIICETFLWENHPFLIGQSGFLSSAERQCSMEMTDSQRYILGSTSTGGAQQDAKFC